MASCWRFLLGELLLLLVVTSTSAFVVKQPPLFYSEVFGVVVGRTQSSAELTAVTQEEDEEEEEVEEVDDTYYEWMAARGIETNGKLEYRPEARSGRGVYATTAIEAGEVIATVPWDLVIATEGGEAADDDDAGWVGRLASMALGYADDDVIVNSALGMRPCVATWRGGGWASEAGESDPWFALDDMDNDDFSLLATGSDNDHNIYQKFGLKCHPVIHRATLRLASICGTSQGANRDAITVRGKAFRACRDNLEKMVTTPRDPSKKGSARDQRVAEAARFWSMCAARAAPVYDAEDSGERGESRGALPTIAIAPVFDILSHHDEPNVELRVRAGEESSGGGDAPAAAVLVAAAAIAEGEALTRSYGLSAPRLRNGAPAPPLGDPWHAAESESERRLRLLLWAGVKPPQV